LRAIALLGLVLALGTARATGATTIRVAAHGGDATDCGTKAAPCRSISQAIALARAGDTVEVGPGRYGDIARDGDFDDPGDEAAEVDTGCDCMIHVDKALTIVARDGADATILDARGATIDVVAADRSGTIFGKKGKGFTLTGAGSGGSGFASDANDIAVAGNVAVHNGEHGIEAPGLRVYVTDNRIIGNGVRGCQCSGNDSTFARNVASDNGNVGFSIDNGNTIVGNLATRNGGDGFRLQNANLVKGNVATANGMSGFTFFGNDNVVVGNVADGNKNGFGLFGVRNLLVKNAIVANLGAGIVAEESDNTVVRSSLFGNGAGRMMAMVPAWESNCGTYAGAGIVLHATENFWGAAAGPGADPADAACDAADAVTTVDPVAKREIKVKPLVPR
jgi:parallel beta-helix repeat protein